MSERRIDASIPDDRDLELVADYAAGEANAEQVAEVRDRLERDPKFRELAAPVLVALHIPERPEPMSPEQLAAHWDEFTKRAGFVHQKRKAHTRRMWIAFATVLVLGALGLFFRDAIERQWDLRRNYYTVEGAGNGAWTRLPDGSEVLLTQGARLRAAKVVNSEGMQKVILDGQARFRVIPSDTVRGIVPQMRPFAVTTPAGVVLTDRAEFTVAVRGDTTHVLVHPNEQRAIIGFMTVPSRVFLSKPGVPNPVIVREGERGRLVR